VFFSSYGQPLHFYTLYFDNFHNRPSTSGRGKHLRSKGLFRMKSTAYEGTNSALFCLGSLFRILCSKRIAWETGTRFAIGSWEQPDAQGIFIRFSYKQKKGLVSSYKTCLGKIYSESSHFTSMIYCGPSPLFLLFNGFQRPAHRLRPGTDD